MFKIFFISLIVTVMCGKSVHGQDVFTQEPEEKVIVYNWSAYIPEGVLKAFTQETGIKVEYSTYDNNEIMYTRLKLLKGRGYDVLVPSTVLVSRMANEGLLQALDHNKLKHFGELDPNLLDKPYDPNNTFSVPYLWGTTGIGIDTDKVDKSQVKRWADLWLKQWKGRLLLTDDMREIFHMALLVNGHSGDTNNPEEIKLAYEKLRTLMPGVKVVSGSPRAEFLSGNVDIGLIWNGEITISKEEKPSLEYIYPEEGVSVWIDSFVIPARATNVDNAHQFIDYMLRPEVAARCVQELGYATPNLKARELLDAKLRNNPVIFPPTEVLADAEFQADAGSEAMELYRLYWDKLKVGE